jgi:hypothetical protein
MEELPR